MQKGLKAIAILIVLSVLSFFIVRRIMKPKEEVEGKALPTVTCISMEKGDIAVKEELLGEISAKEQFRLLSKISGEVLEIDKENGSEVKKGERIALLDNQKQVDAAKYSLEQAKAQAQVTRDSRDRLATLKESGDISVQDFEAADAQAKAAEAQVKAAKLNYDTQVEFSEITAPSDGILQNSILVKGAFIPQGTQLATLIGAGSQQVLFSATEELVKNLSVGQSIMLEKGKESYPGTITEISSVLLPETGLFPVKAEVENTDFPEGSKAKISLTKDSRSSVNILPLNVLYYENGEAFVYVFEGTDGNEGLLRKKKVELGLSGEESAEILSGLSEEDKVVSSWNNEMFDGAKVRLQDKKDESVKDSAKEKSAPEESLEENSTEEESAPEESAKVEKG
ncbi:efflux RND transporter periplasmic adaptor subunit [Oribacterium sp. oral taxon 108]|uniref:efflux RND transporter periplasmic adaptor subunit n=1 Tax=Oribacterium sp. oral taxon 108 TaxID=712414 RepID=UPI00020DD1F1|nr:efflux RND transporter periplasmic adaptor subunit [Oribacterium sp. oral taxon 108]EGL38279.1 efflux transporter, RND family, MFP subunit [Oribacterium sp. oral taxon 108 str. F0425]